MSDPIYLDYQATTPMAPEAAAAMKQWIDTGYWNPHSSHGGGRQAAAAVAVARDQVAALLPVGGRTIFTSGSISPAWFMPISKIANRDDAGQRASVSGTPQ